LLSKQNFTNGFNDKYSYHDSLPVINFLVGFSIVVAPFCEAIFAVASATHISNLILSFFLDSSMVGKIPSYLLLPACEIGVSDIVFGVFSFSNLEVLAQ